MRILVVEDDSLQADAIISILATTFPRDTVELIRSEYEFRTKVADIQNHMPGVIVMDMMLPWCTPRVDIPPPPEDVLRDGFFRAGFRCQKLLEGNEKTKEIPIIFFTVLEKGDLRPQLRDQSKEVIYLQKDDKIDPLITLIREKAKR